MSKLNVSGSATMEFPVDIFNVSITIHSSANNSGETVASGKKKVEQFLGIMKEKLGIEPECFKLEDDSVREEYGNSNSYSYTKKISIDINADLSLLSKMTSLLVELTNVEYRIQTVLLDESEKEKQVIKAAIQDSKTKAEVIASSLGQTIQSCEDISLDYKPSVWACGSLAKSIIVEDFESIESLLKKPTKEISKSIDITWIAE